jgi:hypothetical protein
MKREQSIHPSIRAIFVLSLIILLSVISTRLGEAAPLGQSQDPGTTPTQGIEPGRAPIPS